MNTVTARTITERLMPDGCNQFLIHNPFGLMFDPDKPLPAAPINPAPGDLVLPEQEQWFLYDSWSIDLACKLITLGYPVWLEGMAEEAKGWPQNCGGRDKFSAMVTVYDRALGIAKSSVKAGTIEEHDTPANWIKWAKGKGYSVAHLMPAIKKTVTGTTPGNDWTEQARTIADECYDNDTKMNCRDSLKGYAVRVMDIMQERGIKGPRGIIDNANTVMRDALQGKKWWANKSK